MALLQAPLLDPSIQSFLNQMKAQDVKSLVGRSYEAARKMLEDLQSAPFVAAPAYVEDRDLPVGPSGHIRVTIYRPRGCQGRLPAVMFFHGGGWTLGSRSTHDRLLYELAHAARVAVVFVHYTRSPEAQFPVPIEQAYAATKYVAEHGEDLAIDGTNLAVAGDGAGGNMAAAVTLLAKQRQGPSICYQALLYPVTNAEFDTVSYHAFAEGFWLTKSAMEWMWDAYAPNLADRKKITACPLQATIEELEGLPETLLITSENDVLRDEGEAYAAKLMQARVPVTAVRYLGTCHDFVMLNDLAHTPASVSAKILTSRKLREALYRESD
jgi:acetyl esterase